MRMPLVEIRGAHFEHALVGSDLAAAKEQIEAALVFEKKLHQQMIEEFKSGTPGYPAVNCYLNSKPVILACAVRAAKKRPKRHRPTLETLLGIPSKLTLKKHFTETDWLKLEPKKGGFRIIHDFGPLHRTAKQMVHRVVECSFVPRPFQFTFLGIQKPISQVKQALLKGRTHYATLDIVNHFGSFSFDKLAALLPMLPTAWVDHVVSGRHTVMKWKKGPTMTLGSSLSPSELLHQARSGIPTGSICSSIIAAGSISKLHWEINPVMMWNFADNFLLLAAFAGELQKGIEELTAAMKGLPGGHFNLKIVNQGHVGDGFQFLGHHLSLTDCKVITEPILAVQQSMFSKGNKMGQRVGLAMNKGDEVKALDHVSDFCVQVKGWLAAFAECDDIAEWKAVFIHLIQQEVWPLAIDVEHLMASVQADFSYTEMNISASGTPDDLE
jgi:hypothetical protein